MADDFLAGSGRMEGGGYYTAHSEAQEAYGELGFEWLEQAAADGTLALRRHAARSLPDTYFAAYSADHDLDRYVTSVVDFFRAAFAESLWAALDRNRDASQRETIAARFDELLRQRIAADPERAACRWHVVVLDIVRV